MKEKSEKRERFERVASRRIQSVLNALDSLSKCSNRGNYEYDIQDVTLIIETINKKVSELESIYQKKGKKTRNTDFNFNTK